MKEYNNLINKEISFLIEKKDDYCSEIMEIATHLGDFETENVDLDRLDISAINEKRRTMKAIYDLISDLDKLKKEV